MKCNIQDECLMFRISSWQFLSPRHVSKISHSSENEFAPLKQVLQIIFPVDFS